PHPPRPVGDHLRLLEAWRESGAGEVTLLHFADGRRLVASAFGHSGPPTKSATGRPVARRGEAARALQTTPPKYTEVIVRSRLTKSLRLRGDRDYGVQLAPESRDLPDAQLHREAFSRRASRACKAAQRPDDAR